MNHRERIKAALNFERPNRLPCHESPWEQTLKSWRAQGMPEDVSPEDYFDFDLAFMFLDASPRFEQKVLQREGGYIMHSDHSCPPDVSLSRYTWILERAREIFDT